MWLIKQQNQFLAQKPRVKSAMDVFLGKIEHCLYRLIGIKRFTNLQGARVVGRTQKHNIYHLMKKECCT